MAQSLFYVLVATRSAMLQPLVYFSSVRLRIGQRVQVPLGRRQVAGYVIATDLSEPSVDFEIKPIIKIIDEEPIFTAKYIDIAIWIARVNFASLGEVLFMLGPNAQRETPQKRRVVLEEEEQVIEDHVLTPMQQEAVQQIQTQQGFSYLFGVTGSGKTHVFLQLIRLVRDQSQSVLYLVPEISLSYQTYKFLQAFFPDVALWHSALSPAQRLRTWREIQQGKRNIVLGTRSAILVPLNNLGLIVLDEEHDTAYKSSSTPRYHARQVVMYMAKQMGIKLVMGSATPSLEAYHAMQEGIIQKFSLPARLGRESLPDIRIIDMRAHSGIFSQELVRKILQTYEMGKQSILFLNRRGFARFYFCENCGFELKCKHCSISMTYHKFSDTLLCHYCSYQEKKPVLCPQCGNLHAGFTTFGLEQAEEEAQKIFVNLRIARLDGDIAKKKSELRKILKDFRRGDLDLMLATQIVAKGFNFPSLHLVGILSADVGLSMPDFRARERVFTLLMQVAGRAGRYEDKGEVLIQTYQPQNPAITYSVNRDIEGFYQQELILRQDLGFPPYSRLLRLVFRSVQEKRAQDAATQTAHWLNENCPDGAELLGPAEALIFQIAGNYRWQILLRAPRSSILHHWVSPLHPQLRAFPQVYCEIDSDPVNLL